MDISKLTPRSLQVLLVVLNEENVSKAAAALGVPQPVVSATLNRLRETLSDELVIRGRRGVVLTDKAKRIKPIVSQIVSDLNLLLEDEVFEPSSEVFEFYISCTDYVQSVFMPSVLRKVEEQAPNAKIAVKTLERQKIHSQLESDESHLAIMPSGNAPVSTRAVHLLNETFVVVGKKRSLPKRIDIDWFCAQRHLIVEPSNTNFFGQVDRSLQAVGRSREVVCSAQSFISAVQLLKESAMIATIPKLLALKNFHHFDVRDLPLPVDGFNLSIVWDSRHQKSQRHQWMRNLIRDSASQLEGQLVDL